MSSRQVDFLIVGSMRCGSSSLSTVLNGHPRISLPARELYFFSQDSVYARGERWYEREIKRRTRARCLIGEKCVSYGYIPESRDRIWRYSPDVRLIWILRDPVQRAVSHYHHNVN